MRQDQALRRVSRHSFHTLITQKTTLRIKGSHRKRTHLPYHQVQVPRLSTTHIGSCLARQHMVCCNTVADESSVQPVATHILCSRFMHTSVLEQKDTNDHSTQLAYWGFTRCLLHHHASYAGCGLLPMSNVKHLHCDISVLVMLMVSRPRSCAEQIQWATLCLLATSPNHEMLLVRRLHDVTPARFATAPSQDCR